MAMLVVRRIQRVRGRLLALEARFLAGLIFARVAVRGAALAQGGRAVAVATPLMPRRFAWLCPLVPSDAASYAGQLRVVLAEPRMIALFAACPQAVRIVAPLCRMVGIARSDYVPGERVVVEHLEATPVAPVVVQTRVMPTQAEAMTGIAWVRFIPG